MDTESLSETCGEEAVGDLDVLKRLRELWFV